MYESVSSVPLKGSTSCLFNNLDVFPVKRSGKAASSSSSRNASYLSIQKHTVNIVKQISTSLTHHQVTAKEKNSSSNLPLLTGAKWCSLKTQVVLVITHVKGVQIFDDTGNLLLFWHSTLEPGVLSEGKQAFCRGISSLHDSVFIGTCNGDLLVVEPAANNTFSLVQTISAHPCPVTTISSLRFQNEEAEVDLASADDDGSISLWKKGQSSKVKFAGSITGASFPCTSLCLLPEGLLAAGFYSGHIRVFDTTSCDMVVEIAAHAAAITSMDCALSLRKENDVSIISGSEDTFVRIWKIFRDKNTVEVSQEWQTSVKDLLICGVKFLDTDSSFAVTGYDSKEINLFTRIS